jgi:tRNA pseudouridine32 synthase/23S rRNA pseudouridine746 synthase
MPGIRIVNSSNRRPAFPNDSGTDPVGGNEKSSRSDDPKPVFRPPDMRGVALPVLHRDPGFLVLNKPSGLLSIPGRGLLAQDSVISRVAEWHPEAEGSLMVHRLDMDCSGLILVALNKQTQRSLAHQFEHREVEKTYQSLVEGRVEQAEGQITLPFRLDPDNRPHQVYDPIHGKPGVTNFVVLGFESLSRTPEFTSPDLGSTDPQNDRPVRATPDRNAVTRVRFEPLTGRTHQLRLHAAHPLGLGRPIVGDRLYGDPSLAPRLMLHATEIGFSHPGSGRSIRFRSAPPF